MPGLREAVARALGAPVRELRPVAGGDLNDAYACELDGGARAFVKTASDAAPGAFASEAAGLRWLAEPGALPVPGVLAIADEPGAPRFLVLEWVESGGGLDGEALGRGLAAVHAAGAPAFGGGSDRVESAAGAPRGDSDLVLGPLTLPNAPAPTWPEFYARRRLEPLARLAADRGALPPDAPAVLDRLIARLDDLAGPSEPPARLHGDLWSGNVLAGADGRPWLIDPAAYGGHREVDLAMLRLFPAASGSGTRGAPDRACLTAYAEATPLAAGHEDRVALWQVLPLLAHAALFGGSWGASAVAAMRRYVG